jgi:hypothetical protein
MINSTAWLGKLFLIATIASGQNNLEQRHTALDKQHDKQHYLPRFN